MKAVVVGGGAAGIFCAIAAAENGMQVTVLERSAEFLGKVKISGGGRCNVTHACFESREFTTRYPRGERALIGPFQRFGADETVAWFESRGVRLKTEDDGRMFPTTDSSQTIIDCLLDAAREKRVDLRASAGVDAITRRPNGGFEVTLAGGERMNCHRLLLATGGCRSVSMGKLATSLGHTLEPPVPSLFTFKIADPSLRQLAGASVEDAEVSVDKQELRERGPVLVTHWGLSGPAILRLSAWGARPLESLQYTFALKVNWLPEQSESELIEEFRRRRESMGAKLVVNAPVPPLPARLWDYLVQSTGISRETRWSALSRPQQQSLALRLRACEFQVIGKSLNKDEFVTCGGVRLNEVNFKTMESRLCPGLYFAGEILDLDGITGGFNFQAAWTTGWIAGKSMSEKPIPAR